MKKIILFLILLLTLIYSATSLKTFEINETEKLSLAPTVDDPDADRLTYTFIDPLDENGEWQTDYGDAGEYESGITVSDGVNEVSEEILIIVNRKEAIPTIEGSEPLGDSVDFNEGQSTKFNVVAADLNNDPLTYEWSINDIVVSDKNEILFDTGFQDSGKYKILVVVSDGTFNVSREWNVDVKDVDLDNILEQIENVTITETETARLDLPDFGQFGLSYSISEPLGTDNEWTTGYDDAGEYTIKIEAEGKDFKGEKEITVIVKNNDRPPALIGLKDVKVRENEQLRIELKAVDPDADSIIFSAENIPENAIFEGNTFTWTPNFDFVQKNNIFHYVLDKFKILSISINIDFTAQSNDLTDKKNVKITVRDVNRVFALDSIDDIEVDEGEEIEISPTYNDPDNDKVKFSYSGFMTSRKKATGFDDAGTYVVKITAQDGFFTETRFINVKINDVNRKPEFNRIQNTKIEEGEEIRIELSAADPDNDEISFSAKNLPAGAEIKDNLFVWKPGFEVVDGTAREFLVDFTADDGTDTDTKQGKITVLNKNRAPKIIDTSNNLIVSKDEPTLFKVIAVDEDNDVLTYEWNFGFFDKFEDENSHERIFTTEGTKKVEVKISDGEETVSKVWTVNVV